MRSHQQDEAALAQWTPLINKLAYKASQRAAAIGLPMEHGDWVQELSITVLKCQDSFDPELGVKMITFLHTSMFNEINKVFAKEETRRRIDAHCEEYIDGEGKTQKRKVNDLGFNISGDTTWDSDGTPESIWDHVEDESASPEEYAEDTQLMDFVHAKVDDEASAVLTLLESNHPFITAQLRAYNVAVEAEALAGGIRRFSLDMDFAFICKLLGYSPSKQSRLSAQVKAAIAKYGN